MVLEWIVNSHCLSDPEVLSTAQRDYQVGSWFTNSGRNWPTSTPVSWVPADCLAQYLTEPAWLSRLPGAGPGLLGVAGARYPVSPGTAPALPVSCDLN